MIRYDDCTAICEILQSEAIHLSSDVMTGRRQSGTSS